MNPTVLAKFTHRLGTDYPIGVVKCIHRCVRTVHTGVMRNVTKGGADFKTQVFRNLPNCGQHNGVLCLYSTGCGDSFQRGWDL
jgi:hypothetical protein